MANPFEDDVKAVVDQGPAPASEPLKPEKTPELSSEDNQLLNETMDEYDRGHQYSRFRQQALLEAGDPNPDANVKEFAEAHGVTEEEAKKLLQAYAEPDASLLSKAEELSVTRPEIIEWAAKSPENYRFIRDNYPHMIKATDPEFSIQTPVLMQDMGKALKRNMPMLENMVAVGRYSLGELSKEEFAEKLSSIRQRRENQTPYGTDTTGFDNALAEFNRSWKKGMTFADVSRMPREDIDDYIKVLARAMEVSGATAIDIAELTYAAAVENPAGTFLKSTESLGAVLGPTAGALAGSKLGAVGGPKTAVVGGIVGGTLGSGLIRYAQEVEEQLNSYVDNNPGRTYMDALDDPEVMANVKKIATTYGLVGGALDTLLTRLGGNIATGGLTRRTLGIGLDVAGEGVAEAGATTAKEVAKGKPVLEAASEGLREGVVESILAAPTSATIGFIPGVYEDMANKTLMVKRKTLAKNAVATVKGQMDVVEGSAKKVVKKPEDAAKLRELIKTASRKEEVVKAEEEAAKEAKAKTESEVIDETLEESDSVKTDAPREDVLDIPEDSTEETKPAQKRPKKKSKLREEAILEQTELSDNHVAINAALFYQAFQAMDAEQRGMTWEEFVKFFSEGVQQQLANTNSDLAEQIFIAPSEWAIALSALKNTEGLYDIVLVKTPWGYEPAVPQDETTTKEKKKEEKKTEKIGIPKEDAKPSKAEEPKAFSRFASLEEENQYEKLKGKVTKAISKVERFRWGTDLATNPEAVQVFTDMFFNMARFRAETTGKSITDILNTYVFTETSDYDKAGFVSPILGGLRRQVIAYNPNSLTAGAIGTIVHEFGHVLLNNIITDWDAIMAIPEDKLTPAQEHYKDTMLLTAKVLNLPNLKGVFLLNKYDSNVAQEKFATSIELFFKRGEFKDTDTGRLMLRFQQLMKSVIPEGTYNRLGMSYEEEGILPVGPENKDVSMVFNALLDTQDKLVKEVYPLIPPPEFDRTDLGDQYRQWMREYRKAVEIAMLEVYKEMFNDSIDFYRSHYNEIYTKEYNKLLETPIGMIHSLMRDGYIVLHEKDLADALGITVENAKTMADKYGIKLAQDKINATATVENLSVEYGLGDENPVHEDLADAIALESKAAMETLKRLEEMNEEIPTRELKDLSNIILSNKNIKEVRIKAGNIVKAKMLKKLKDNENITEELKKEIRKGVTDKVLDEKAKTKLLNTNHLFLPSTKGFESMETAAENSSLSDKRFAIMVPTKKSALADNFNFNALKKHLSGMIETDSAQKDIDIKQDKTAKVEEALDTGEIPTLFTAIEQLLVHEKKIKLMAEVNKQLVRLDEAWTKQASKGEGFKITRKGMRDIYVFNASLGDILLADSQGMTSHKTIEDDGLHELVTELMNRRENMNMWSRMKYGQLLIEAQLKAQLLAKGKYIPTKKQKKDAKVSLADVKTMLNTLGVDALPKNTPIPMVPSAPETSFDSGDKKLSFDETMAEISRHIVSEVKKFPQAQKEPGNFITKYFYMDSISMKNFIASMMDEKSLHTSWLYSLFHRVSEAEAKKNVIQNQYHERITKAVKKFAKSRKDLKKVVGRDAKSRQGLYSILTGWATVDSKVIKAPEIGKNVSFKNLGQVITALLYMGSESGRNKMLLGGFINSEGVETGPLGISKDGYIDSSGWDAFIQRLVNEGILTEEAFDFVQEVHNIFTEVFPKVKQSFKDVDGMDINFVEGREYTVNFGDKTKKYSGGYYPLLPDRTLIPMDIIDKGDGFSNEQFSIVYDSMDSSMGKSRGGQIYPMQLGLGNLMGLLNKHLTHAYIKRPLQIIDNLRRQKPIVEVFENRQRGFISNVLNPWIERVAKQRYSIGNPGFMNSLALHLRRSSYITLFLLEIRPVLKQLFGIVQAVPTLSQYVGNSKMLKHYMKVAGSVMTGRYGALKDDISKQSVYMKERMMHNERNLVRGWDEMELTENIHGDIMSKSERITYVGMQFAQNIVDMGIWMAAVERVKQDGGTDKQAYDYADGLVERTQASGNISARPQALHGTHWERMAMMISMVSHGIRGRIYENSVRAKDKSNSVALARINAALWMVLIPRIIEHIAAEARDKLDDDDDGDPEIPELMSQLSADMASAMAPQVANIFLPLLGGGTDILFGADTHGRGGELFGLGPVANPLRKGQRGFMALSRKIRYGVPMTYKDWGNFYTGLGAATGLPLAPIDTYIYQTLDARQSKIEKKQEARKRRKILNKVRKKR